MGDERIERFRRTKSGHSQADFIAVLEHYGYELVGHVRHGAMYRHPLLAKHPDRSVRMTLAQVVIPKGKELKKYVAEDVTASVDMLLRFKAEIEK